MGNKRQMSKRVLSLLMAVVMVLGTMPMPVFAEEEVHAYSDEEAVTVSGWPTIRTDLTHIICYGQSFSTGSDAPYYEDPAVNGVYVYGNITNSPSFLQAMCWPDCCLEQDMTRTLFWVLMVPEEKRLRS